MQKGITHVMPNSVQGTMSIVSDTESGTISASVTVVQKSYEITPAGLLMETRIAELIDSIERITSLNLVPGQALKGNIVIEQQVYPIIEDMPEVYLLKDDSGIPVRTQGGECVWLRQYYSENEYDTDIILVDAYQTPDIPQDPGQ